MVCHRKKLHKSLYICVKYVWLPYPVKNHYKLVIYMTAVKHLTTFYQSNTNAKLNCKQG